MKKILSFGCLIMFCSSLVYGDSSKEFSVISDLVESLHLLDWGSSYEVAEGDDITTKLTKLMNQNGKYELAARSMEGYLQAKDKFILDVAEGIYVGALSLVDANAKLIDKIRKATNGDPEGFKDMKYTIAETNAQKKKAWEVILVSAGWSLPVIMEYPATTDNPTGKIPFKISDSEREDLVKRIDELFGEKLERYKKFHKLSKKGKETNPNDSTYIIAGIEIIRDNLSTETYEEAKAKKTRE
ncbi:MAG: hypothetical protein ACREXW_05110 [Gammaproteobacteria bacterium]